MENLQLHPTRQTSSQTATILWFSLKLSFHVLPKDIYWEPLFWCAIPWLRDKIHLTKQINWIYFCKPSSLKILPIFVWTVTLYELQICLLYGLQITQLRRLWPVWVFSLTEFTCFIIRLCVELFWYILLLIGYPLSSNFVTDLFSAVWLRDLKHFANRSLQSFCHFQSQITDATSWCWVA